MGEFCDWAFCGTPTAKEDIYIPSTKFVPRNPKNTRESSVITHQDVICRHTIALSLGKSKIQQKIYLRLQLTIPLPFYHELKAKTQEQVFSLYFQHAVYQCMEKTWAIVNLGLNTEPLVPLLGNGQLDSLALGQRDERLVALQ